ncbi:hypothetical protein RRG08_038702 [Elysia crispata]|uniref:Uncharacterized protein n=1 Tax=Elysia crispata TaxID=231223 RepID=A0AAE1DGY4_9GAST|nr:hypothetical protein RRG08_038702 [Elysia crispata]
MANVARRGPDSDRQTILGIVINPWGVHLVKTVVSPWTLIPTTPACSNGLGVVSLFKRQNLFGVFNNYSALFDINVYILAEVDVVEL